MKNFHQFVAEQTAIIAEKEQPEDYRGEHEAPGPGSGAPLHDVTPHVYPEDFHSSKGAQMYGDGTSYDHESHSIITRVKGRPNASVKIYRAVPHEPSHEERLATAEKAAAHYMKTGNLKHTEPGIDNYDKLHDHITSLTDHIAKNPGQKAEKKTINPGDWVTLSKKYADEHGRGALRGKYKVLSKTVKASEVYTNGDSIHEQGYHPNKK